MFLGRERWVSDRLKRSSCLDRIARMTMSPLTKRQTVAAPPAGLRFVTWASTIPQPQEGWRRTCRRWRGAGRFGRRGASGLRQPREGVMYSRGGGRPSAGNAGGAVGVAVRSRCLPGAGIGAAEPTHRSAGRAPPAHPQPDHAAAAGLVGAADPPGHHAPQRHRPPEIAAVSAWPLRAAGVWPGGPDPQRQPAVHRRIGSLTTLSSQGPSPAVRAGLNPIPMPVRRPRRSPKSFDYDTASRSGCA